LKNKLSTIARFLFFLGIGVFFIWIFMRSLTHDQKKEIMLSFRHANYAWIIFAILLGILSHFIRSLRWKMLMEPMGYIPRSSNVFFAVMIGYLANLALPRLGEVSRCGILTRYEKIPFTKSFGTVITERAVDMIMFIILFFTTIYIQSERLNNYLQTRVYNPLVAKFHYSIDFSAFFIFASIGIGLILVASLILLWRLLRRSALFQKIKAQILGFLEGIKSLYSIKQPLIFIFYSLAIWVLYLLMAYFVFFSLPATSSLSLDAGLGVLIFGSIGIMVVQGGIGIYPAIVAETLILYSITKTTGYAMGWLIWSSQTLTVILLGVLSLILLPLLNKPDNVKS
jgi:glycosyltransferase 2 family protein